MAQGNAYTSQGAIPKATRMNNDAAGQSILLARRGFEMCEERRFSEAVNFFTRAIALDRSDYRYFENRSYAYSHLGQYERALEDANVAIILEPTHAKCHLRRGIALSGLELYAEAQRAYERTMELDPGNKYALKNLKKDGVRRIVEMGFAPDKALWAVEEKKGDLESAVEALCEPFSSNLDIYTAPCNPGGFRSVWVGNIKPSVTESKLIDLFGKCGDVHSIKILHDTFCAFINYRDELSASRAMKELQGYVLCGAPLVIRFPYRKGF